MPHQPPTVSALPEPFAWIGTLVRDVFAVADVTTGVDRGPALRLRGALLVASEEAYARQAPAVRARGYWLALRRQAAGDELILLRPPEARRAPRLALNAVLAVATLLSVLFAYAFYWSGVDIMAGGLWAAMRQGLGFAASVLGIVLAHELGHYGMARHLGVHVTPPFLIPFPLSPMGTMGAAMVLSEPPPNRRAMLRIGLAGPLAGLLVALPVLLYGLSRSSVGPLPSEGGYVAEGNSLLYLALKALVHGRLLPSGGVDVDLHPLAFAGWSGLLMTGVNLLPVGQLDGGHILSAWLGRRARRFVWPILGVLLLLGIWWRGWLLWAALVFLLSRGQVEPLDGISALRRGDIALAIGTLLLFALLFTPIPMRIV